MSPFCFVYASLKKVNGLPQCWRAGPFQREPEPVKSPKNGSKEPGARPVQREPEPVKEIYNNGSQELGARPFLERDGAEIR